MARAHKAVLKRNPATKTTQDRRCWPRFVPNFRRTSSTTSPGSANDSPRQGIEVKPSDSRARAFIEQYGDRCWETDILPAATIEQALDDHIRSWLDAKLGK